MCVLTATKDQVSSLIPCWRSGPEQLQESGENMFLSHEKQ